MITQNDLKNVVNAAKLAGFGLTENDLLLNVWACGIETHKPTPLPKNFSAVYMYLWNEQYLKVGMAGKNSNARYQSHHYNYNSSGSNLSKSLLKEADFKNAINESNVGNWIIENTTRFNILIPSRFTKNLTNFIEAFFILKLNPRFEK